jgi:X-linked retinitis pigmentosa GTPase regulator
MLTLFRAITPMKKGHSPRFMCGEVSHRHFHLLDDYYGQLGVGFEKTQHPVPKVCSFNILIRQVSCGEDHTAFIVEPSGQVYAMGNNSDGKLGVGQPNLKYSNVPCLVDGLQGITKVACGSSHTLAIHENGTAFSWGQGYNGALGLNDLGSQDRPRQITVPI